MSMFSALRRKLVEPDEDAAMAAARASFTPFSYGTEPPIEFDFIKRAWFPQEQHFMVEMMPYIHALMRTFDYKAKPILSVLDVGARCAQGSGLLASMHPTTDLWFKPALQVTAIEMETHYPGIAAALAPDVNYIVGDLFKLPAEPKWDIVIASHIVEHFEDPYPLVEHLKSRAASWLVVYTPYNEQQLLSCHFRVDDTVVNRMRSDYSGVVPSYGWRHEHDERSDCIIQIFDMRSDKSRVPEMPLVKPSR